MSSFETRLVQYRQLEAKIDAMEEEHKARVMPFKEAREKLRALMLKMLHDSGQDSAKTAVGTVYRLTRTSVSLDDPTEFRRHVIGSENWDLIDWKANKSAVADYATMNEGQLPPGVKVTQMLDIGVRAPAAPRTRKTAASVVADPMVEVDPNDDGASDENQAA
jgi:hypothetical protein